MSEDMFECESTEETNELPAESSVVEELPEVRDEPSEVDTEEVRDIAAPSEEDGFAQERAALKEEIEMLRKELEKQTQQSARYVAELREFSDIFGKEAIDKVPESVWKSMEGGVPLAAAYALYEKKTQLLEMRAETVNKKNAAMSTGAVTGADESGFYSPDEVRAMSSSEVKKNYNLIRESMKKWN